MVRDYDIADIQDRLFFIKDAIDREKMSMLCEFANTMKCFTFSKVKESIEETEDTYIIENVSNGKFELVLHCIFAKRLWSEGC